MSVILIQQVRGKHELAHRVYDIWGSAWNFVDRINEDYHNHFQLHGSKSSNSFALESVAYIVAITIRALWEEHRYMHAHARTRGNSRAAQRLMKLDIPHYFLNAAKGAATLPDLYSSDRKCELITPTFVHKLPLILDTR